MAQTSERLDVALVKRGFAESREKAQRLIGAGLVRVDGNVVDKQGRLVGEHNKIFVEAPPRYVGRGGEKLEYALDFFKIEPAGCVCLDIGASTGGFTDCLLQRGASKVFAIDVGWGQLHWRIRKDPRVVVFERTNARYLTIEEIGEMADLATVDVSFISLTKILPAVKQICRCGSKIVTLIKPQFEAGREQVNSGGVVRDQSVRDSVINKIRTFGENELGLKWLGVCESPLLGPAGNVEYFAAWANGNNKEQT